MHSAFSQRAASSWQLAEARNSYCAARCLLPAASCLLEKLLFLLLYGNSKAWKNNLELLLLKQLRYVRSEISHSRLRLGAPAASG